MEKKSKPKGRKWDGKSRVSTDLYRNRWNEIFGKKEQDELKESYEQSLRNKKEREKIIEKENEEYLKQLKDKI